MRDLDVALAPGAAMNPPSKGDEFLGRLIDAPAFTRRAYIRSGFGELRPFELQVLIALVVDGPQTASALVDRLALTQGAVSAAMSALVAQGHAVADVDQHDGRRRNVRATPGGRALVSEFGAFALRQVEHD